MNISWIGGCPAGWSCYCYAFAFLCIRSQTVWNTLSVSLSITTTSTSFSLSKGFHFLMSQSGFATSACTLIYYSFCLLSFPKWYSMVFDLLSCSLTLSVILKTSRKEDNHRSFFNLSFSSSFPICFNPSLDIGASGTVHSKGQPVCHYLSPSLAAAFYEKFLKCIKLAILFQVSPGSCNGSQASNIWATPPT